MLQSTDLQLSPPLSQPLDLRCTSQFLTDSHYSEHNLQKSPPLKMRKLHSSVFFGILKTGNPVSSALIGPNLKCENVIDSKQKSKSYFIL